MGLANKLNSNRQTVADGIDTKELDYVKAADIAFEDGDPIILRGFFIQSGKYGESITLVADNNLGINIPSRYVQKFKEYSDDDVELIKAGKLGIAAIHKDVETKNGKTTTLDFIDLD